MIIYDFLLVFNMWPNSAPLQDITPINVNDLDFG